MTRDKRQALSIERWKQAGGCSTIVASTGYGKTVIAINVMKRMLQLKPTAVIRVIVPTKVLKDQWESKITFNGDIKVLIINTAIKKPFRCDLLILDEAHRYNSLTFKELFNKCTYHFVLGLTATFERLDGLEKEVMERYCPVCDTVTIKESLENGWAAPYREYKVMLDVDLTEYKKANETFIKHFSFFNFDFKLALDAVTNPFVQQKIAKEVNCELKEVKAHAYAWSKALQFRKKFIANHPKKVEIVNKIIAARSDKKIITFNTSIEQCKRYGNGVIVSSEQTKKQNQTIIAEFAKQKTGVIHSSKMLIEGLDCPGLSVGIVAGFNSSKTAKTQEVGRVIRVESGKQAEIFTLVIKGTVENEWFKKANEDNDYIEIDEKELDLVLNNKLNKQAKTQDKVNNELLRI